MLNFTKILLSACILFYSSNLYADDIIAKCSVSPYLGNSSLSPEEFATSNNLRRKTASPLIADGTPIIIKGRVFDKNCVPIPRAIVNIWHNDANGYNLSDAEKIDSNFLGSGTVATDNLGFFQFLTIKPAKSKGDKYVAVDFQVNHKVLDEPFNSSLFFNLSGAKKSGSKLPDSDLKKLVATYDDSTNTYFLDIVLDVSNDYRSF